MIERLPLGAEVVRGDDELTISLRVRTEAVRVSKRVVTAERVVVRRQPSSERARYETRVQRERLRVRVQRDLDATEPLSSPDATT